MEKVFTKYMINTHNIKPKVVSTSEYNSSIATKRLTEYITGGSVFGIAVFGVDTYGAVYDAINQTNVKMNTRSIA